jgi:hypothetical protein
MVEICQRRGAEGVARRGSRARGQRSAIKGQGAYRRMQIEGCKRMMQIEKDEVALIRGVGWFVVRPRSIVGCRSAIMRPVRPIHDSSMFHPWRRRNCANRGRRVTGCFLAGAAHLVATLQTGRTCRRNPKQGCHSRFIRDISVIRGSSFPTANKPLNPKGVVVTPNRKVGRPAGALPVIAQNWSNIARLRKIATGYGILVQINDRFLPCSREACTGDPKRATPQFYPCFCIISPSRSTIQPSHARGENERK